MPHRLSPSLLAVLFVAGFVHGETVQPVLTVEPDRVGFEQLVAPIFKQYCLRCHGPDKSEGEFRVDQHLELEFSKTAVANRWNEVVNVLNSHEMPPPDEPQPTAETVAKLVDWIRGQQIRAEEVDGKSAVVLRRLNRNEYRNTIRDLVGVDFDISHFPQDPPAGGFDNNGRALSSSPLQVELYLQAAQSILDEAFVTGPSPDPIAWRFEPETGDNDSNRVRYGKHNAIVNGGNNPLGADNQSRVLHHASWDRNINARDFAVPTAGTYLVRIRAASQVPTRAEVVAYADRTIREHRAKEMAEHPERRQWIEAHLADEINHFRDSPNYDYGPGRLKVTVHLDGQPHIIGEFDVAPLATTARPTAGSELSLAVTQDDMQVFEFPIKMTTEKAGITLDYAYSIPREVENFEMQRSDGFPRPEVIVDWFEIAGPVNETWPPQTQQRLLGSDISGSQSKQREVARVALNRFMARAYRRPVTNAEIDEKLLLYDAAKSYSFIEDMKAPLTAVLVSPNFLYLAEPYRTNPDDELSPYEFATRLSYFLWSSMPDDALFRAASRNEFSDPEKLIAQIDRMLADDKSESLGNNFAAQWFGLRDVGANPPVEELYSCYNDHVEASLVRQSIALFDDILHNDRDLAEFIDSDYEMLNEVLCRYYSLSKIAGDEMQRVKLPADSHRGGILTHGSMLTITSNGTRTSPVKRGTWILKNILGSDPGLPVANAGDIAPKVPGIDKATVRQRLESHRQLPQCARCHNKIDPLGFALENYNAAGRYRTQEGFGYQGRVEEHDPLIDASGRLPDGTEINGVADLKAAVLKQDAKFVRCLSEKMFTYALGREMMTADQPVIDRAVTNLLAAQAQHQPRTLRSMIHEIVSSPTFAKR